MRRRRRRRNRGSYRVRSSASRCPRLGSVFAMIPLCRTIRKSPTCDLASPKPTRCFTRMRRHTRLRSAGSNGTESAVSRFAGMYKNNIPMITSSRTMEDVKTLSMQQFPEKGKYAAFKYMDACLVLMDSAKFRTGVDSGWPKWQRVNIASEYSSSTDFHDLPDDAEEAPTPLSFPAAVARFGKRRHNGGLGEAPAGPRRSNRQLLVSSRVPSSPTSRACSSSKA